MPTNITNEASANYQFAGSSNTLLVTSNTNNLILEDNSGLALSKTATPTTYSNGTIVTYSVSITNTSSLSLTGVRIIDNLGNGNLAYVTGSGSLSTSSETYPVNPVATSPLTFTLQELGPGQTMTLTYRGQVLFNLPLSVSSITNSVQGIGYTNTGTINGYANSTITRASTGSLTMVKDSSSTSVYPNEVFNYTISLANSSQTQANLTSITDQLPANFVVSSITTRTGNGSPINLSSTDYNIKPVNLLTINTVQGSPLTVPADGITIVTITGYFS